VRRAKEPGDPYSPAVFVIGEGNSDEGKKKKSFLLAGAIVSPDSGKTKQHRIIHLASEVRVASSGTELSRGKQRWSGKMRIWGISSFNKEGPDLSFLATVDLGNCWQTVSCSPDLGPGFPVESVFLKNPRLFFRETAGVRSITRVRRADF